MCTTVKRNVCWFKKLWVVLILGLFTFTMKEQPRLATSPQGPSPGSKRPYFGDEVAGWTRLENENTKTPDRLGLRSSAGRVPLTAPISNQKYTV